MDTVVKLDGLIRKYDNRAVVDGVSLEIREGEIFGLLGPNGAGKSTTMNMICSLITPTAGEIELFGCNIRQNPHKVKPMLGYIPQELAIYSNLKAWENVELFTSLYGIRGRALKEAIDESLAFVELEDKRDAFAKTFSGGMKRRLNIACALGHRPRLLIFDEPTVGIDPQSRNFILEKIRQANRGGTTVIYTSHYMEEVEALCSRAAIMDNGKIIACGTVEELKNMVRRDPSEEISLETVFLTLTGKSLRDSMEG